MRSACLLSSSVARVSLELMFFITKFQNRAQLVLARVIRVVATMLVFDRKGCYIAIYLINSGFLFVCLSRTIFGKKKGAHVQIEGEKHGNRDTGLNMVCTQ